MSGFWLYRRKYRDHWCIPKINTEIICKSSKNYFIIVTMGRGKKTYKLWICQSVGKLKVVGHQAKSKMKDLSIHTITDIQLHVRHHGMPKVQIWGFGQIYEISLQALPGKPPPYFKDHRQYKNMYLLSYVYR